MFSLFYVPPQCQKWGYNRTTPPKFFRSLRARNNFVSLTEKNRGAALDYHSLNFASGQIEPTTARVARVD